jgi:hypothetical protein
MDILKNKVNVQYREYFEIAYKLNRCIYSVLQDKELLNLNHYESDANLYIILMFCEMHKTFQSSIILLQFGLPNDTSILFRSLYDKMFKLMAIIKDNNNYHYIEKETNEHKVQLKKKVLKEENYAHLWMEVQNIDCTEIDHQFVTDKIWAELAGMSNEYNIQYKILSNDAHTGLGVLKEMLIENGERLTINISYKFNNIKENIIVICDLVNRALIEVLKYFNIATYTNSTNTILKEIDELSNCIQ